MKKRTLIIKRLSPGTLLKIMLVTSLFPWVLIDTGIILYHLLSGDFVVNYYSGVGPERVAEQISIGKYILLSYPIFVLMGIILTLILWVPCVLSLWLWSKVHNMQIAYYVQDSKKI